MGTRTSLKKAGVPSRPTPKRVGGITDAERNLVAQVVLDQPAEVTPAQVNGLARALRRSKAAIKTLIEDAQESFRENAGFYVDAHRKATESALTHGSIAGLEVAQKGAQWAIERMSGEGARIIEPKVEGGNQGGPRVMVGIRVGGLDATKELSVTSIDVAATPGEASTPVVSE